MRSLQVGVAITLLTVTASAVVMAFPEGAPAQHTGGFGEVDCGQCHYAGDDQGQLDIANWPETITPGQTYSFDLVLRDSTALVAGFQLSIRNQAGEQLGQFAAADGQQVQTAEGVAYLTHNQPQPSADEEGAVNNRWQITWRAPAAESDNDQDTAPVVHAVAVAANHDESPLGDTVIKLANELK